MTAGEPPVERLAVYGTLMPGAENHWLVRPIAGEWSRGHVRGWAYPIGFGPAEGFPGLTLDPNGNPVPVAVLASTRLDRHWREIDDFEGPGYRRVECEVWLDDDTAPDAGAPDRTVTAWIYETDPEAE